ncbi:MAG: hypothetical protein HY721_08815 [Planctomycetes bacterium]|nr:hypothetical protein [Planctomycetota bacterium]
MKRIPLALSLASAAALAAIASCTRQEKPPPVPPSEVLARRVKGALPAADPASGEWAAAPEHVSKLLLQDQTEPKLAQATVESVRVRALHDGQKIAFCMEWLDASADRLSGPSRFSDAAAVQVPLAAGGDVPDAAMGQRKKAVRIHLWKAEWQEELEKGVDPVKALYPNVTVDHYPYDQADAKARPAMEALYAPAKALGNPVAARRSDAPTQDLAAEGFGTLTPLHEQVSTGRGVHDGKRWAVTIARPLDPREGEALRAGARTYAAFAVWDGAAGNVGARKMRTTWIPLLLEGAP